MTQAAAPADRTSRKRGLLLIIIGSVLISFSAVFVRLANIGPTQAGVYRNVFGAVALLVVRNEMLGRRREAAQEHQHDTADGQPQAERELAQSKNLHAPTRP